MFKNVIVVFFYWFSSNLLFEQAVCKLFSESDVNLPKFNLKSSLLIEGVQIIEHQNVKETSLQKGKI